MLADYRRRRAPPVAGRIDHDRIAGAVVVNLELHIGIAEDIVARDDWIGHGARRIAATAIEIDTAVVVRDRVAGDRRVGGTGGVDSGRGPMNLVAGDGGRRRDEVNAVAA